MILLLISVKIIPYALAALIAYQKGFPRASVLGVLGIINVIYTIITGSLPPLFSTLITMFFSLALLFHVLDLKARR